MLVKWVHVHLYYDTQLVNSYPRFIDYFHVQFNAHAFHLFHIHVAPMSLLYMILLPDFSGQSQERRISQETNLFFHVRHW